MPARFYIYFVLLVITSLGFVSCDKNRVFEKYTEIPNNTWSSVNPVTFDVDIADTLTAHNFYVNIRHAEAYPYSNLYLFINTRFPSGKMAIDTLECILADENGKWLGDGLGDLFDNQILFKRNVRFPSAGKYTFEIRQGMRVDQLPMIVDVGFRVEKNK